MAKIGVVGIGILGMSVTNLLFSAGHDVTNFSTGFPSTPNSTRSNMAWLRSGIIELLFSAGQKDLDLAVDIGYSYQSVSELMERPKLIRSAIALPKGKDLSEYNKDSESAKTLKVISRFFKNPPYFSKVDFKIPENILNLKLTRPQELIYKKIADWSFPLDILNYNLYGFIRNRVNKPEDVFKTGNVVEIGGDYISYETKSGIQQDHFDYIFVCAGANTFAITNKLVGYKHSPKRETLEIDNKIIKVLHAPVVRIGGKVAGDFPLDVFVHSVEDFGIVKVKNQLKNPIAGQSADQTYLLLGKEKQKQKVNPLTLIGGSQKISFTEIEKNACQLGLSKNIPPSDRFCCHLIEIKEKASLSSWIGPWVYQVPKSKSVILGIPGRATLAIDLAFEMIQSAKENAGLKIELPEAPKREKPKGKESLEEYYQFFSAWFRHRTPPKVSTFAPS